jgi:tRNA (guanosine-2'-O-)-methyltransferase
MSATTESLRKSPDEIRVHRLRVPNSCGNIITAALWPKKGENLGTLARTCDAVGACLAVPRGREPNRAVIKGNTIGVHNTCLHYADTPESWLEDRRIEGWRVLGVELAHDSTPLEKVRPAYGEKVIMVLGNECQGIPDSAWPYLDEVIEIPMMGVGNSLNVAVAGSLVLYKLAGWS